MLRQTGVFSLASTMIAFLKTPSRRGRRTRRPERLPSRVRFRPHVGLLEQRTLLSALPTLTALRASTASAALGQSVTFTATVSDLSAGGATPNGGTVTFSDQSGALDSETLVDGVAEFTTSSLAAGTNTVTASYGGTADFAPSTTGTIVTAAGNGTAGYAGNNGPATAAELNGPHGLAIDSAGDLFIADTVNNVVREVVKATGDIITVAGNGTAGYSGDNGPATAAELNDPDRVAVDSAGDLFIADYKNNVVRELTPAVTVTIGPRHTPTINWPSPAAITYGTALGTAQLDATASVTGTFSYTPSAGKVLGAGDNQALSVTFTPTDSTDYAGATKTVTINVDQAAPEVSVNPVNLTYGTPLANSQLSGTATWTVGGNEVTVPGTWSYTAPRVRC